MTKQEWISNKIAFLIRTEGYDRKQAAAIAYSMYGKEHKNGGTIPEFQPGGLVSTNTAGYFNPPTWGASPAQPAGVPGAATPRPGFNPMDALNTSMPTFEQWQQSIPTSSPSAPVEVPQAIAPPVAGTVAEQVTPYTQPVATAPQVATPSPVETPEWYKNNNPYFMTEPGAQSSPAEPISANPDENPSTFNPQPNNRIQFFNPYGGFDIPSAAGMLGESIENKNTLGMVSSGLKLATGLGRNIFGAMGQARRENEVMKDYYQKQRDGMSTTVMAQDGGEMAFNINEPTINPGGIPGTVKKRFSNEMKTSVVRGILPTNTELGIQTNGALTPEQEKASLAAQKPIKFIQKVSTTVDKSNGSLPPGDYHKVYYTDPRRAKIENEDFEYINDSGMGALKRMPNYRVYMEQLQKHQNGGTAIDNTYVPKPKILKNNAPQRQLSEAELDALAHQFRGSGLISPTNNTFVKNPDAIMNDTGNLDSKQMEELRAHMESANAFEQLYQGLPNIGRMFGDGFSAADLPAHSPLRKKEDGGLMEFKSGGEMSLAKALTGNFMTGMDENNPMAKPNAEIEAGEYVKTPEGETKEVIGDTHEKGGEEVQFEGGEKILSDHLKIGAEAAKHFRKEYDIEVKATDTYATVLDKFSRKVGLTKLLEQEEELIEKLEKQTKDVKDPETLGLNVQALSNEINDVTKEKAPLEAKRADVFEELFKKQEDSKPKSEKEDESKMENGGLIKTFAQANGISFERAKELMQQGGIFDVPNDPTARRRGNIYSPTNPNSPFFAGNSSILAAPNGRVGNVLEDPATFIHQDEYGDGYFGQSVLQNPTTTAEQNRMLHPELYAKHFEPGKFQPRDPKAFQADLVAKYETMLRTTEQTYGVGSPEAERLKQQINQDTFLNDQSVRGKDGKFGNFTSTRPNYEMPVLPKDILAEVKNSGANTSSQLKKMFPDYYEKYVASKGIEDADFWLGEEGEPAPKADVPGAIATVENQPQADTIEDRGRMNFMLLPDQSPMLPESLQAHLKLNRRFDRVEPALISPEQNMQELNRSQGAMMSQINNTAGAERAAQIAALTGNIGENINKVSTTTDTFNAQATARAGAQNAQIQAMEENARGQDALSYEQRQLRAKALTDYDVRNYYNRLQENNVRNFDQINNLNYVNANADHHQFNGMTFEQISNPYFTTGAPLLKSPAQLALEREAEAKAIKAAATAEAKKKLKFGGRFKN